MKCRGGYILIYFAIGRIFFSNDLIAAVFSISRFSGWLGGSQWSTRGPEPTVKSQEWLGRGLSVQRGCPDWDSDYGICTWREGFWKLFPGQSQPTVCSIWYGIDMVLSTVLTYCKSRLWCSGKVESELRVPTTDLWVQASNDWLERRFRPRLLLMS